MIWKLECDKLDIFVKHFYIIPTGTPRCRILKKVTNTNDFKVVHDFQTDNPNLAVEWLSNDPKDKKYLTFRVLNTET